MKKNLKLWLAALILAGVTTLMFCRYLSDLKKRYEPHNLTPVVVAARDLKDRAVISPQDVKVIRLPKEFAAQGVFSQTDQAVGKMVQGPVNKGEQITLARVVDERARRGELSFLVPKGLRAVSVAVNAVSGVSGFVKPGDRVDVLATVDLPVQEQKGEVFRTFSILTVQNVEVLAVGNSTGGETLSKQELKEELQTVTLAVSPEEAQVLTLAAEKGKIRMLLRNPAEGEEKHLPPYELRSLLGIR